MEVAGDWLSEATGDLGKQKAAREAEINFAQLYLIFTEGRGKQLLEFWESTLCKKRIPVDSSIAVYAAHNAVREFVEGFKAQIELANSAGLRF